LHGQRSFPSARSWYLPGSLRRLLHLWVCLGLVPAAGILVAGGSATLAGSAHQDAVAASSTASGTTNQPAQQQAAANGQDVVYLSPAGERTGQIRLVGRVLEYTGRQLQIVLAGGRQQTFPGQRVLRIETAVSAEQQEAERRMAAGRWAEAVALYSQARQNEPRAWVRRQITAQMVRCYQQLGRLEMAGEEFLVLVQSDPQTPYFERIPLAWTAVEPSPALYQAALRWLTRSDIPAAGLLGASYLLSGAMRPQAVARLEQLVLGRDRRVAQLAMAQLWRVRLVTATTAEVADWEKAVEQIPRNLRAGPYFVLGSAWAQKQQWQQAALAWMRIPILYSDHRRLAARALLRAADALERLDRPEKATPLLARLVQQYADLPEAAEAQDRLRAREVGNTR